MAEQNILNFRNILLWKLVFRKSGGKCREFISALTVCFTLDRITVETESEDPPPA